MKKELTVSPIETERLILDPLRQTDRESFFRCIAHDRKVLETFLCPYAETLESFDFSPYLAHRDSGRVLAIRLKDSQELIGIVTRFEEQGDACEIGYAVGSDYWKRGYATEAVRAFIRSLFEQGFRTVSAGFFTGNDASRRVMEKCGMTFRRFAAKELTYQGLERDVTYFAIRAEA